jgi:hypothetical protein
LDRMIRIFVFGTMEMVCHLQHETTKSSLITLNIIC